MTEAQAIAVVRRNFPAAIPRLVSLGHIEMLMEGKVVAVLNQHPDHSWTVGEQHVQNEQLQQAVEELKESLATPFTNDGERGILTKHSSVDATEHEGSLKTE